MPDCRHTNDRDRDRQPILDLHELSIGTWGVLDRLNQAGVSVDNIEKVKKTYHAIFDIHRDQVRPISRQRYVCHPIAVAEVLVNKLGITDPDAVIAALLHDAAEDQTPRILDTIGFPSPELDGDCVNGQRLAIEILSEDHHANNPAFVKECLLSVTNPNFQVLGQRLKYEAEKSESPDNYISQSFARDLLCAALEVQPQSVNYHDEAELARFVRETPRVALRNLLYLGHWSKILSTDCLSRAIKLADFYENALSRNELLEDVASLRHDPERYDKALGFCERVRLKYMPVLHLIETRLEQAQQTGTPLLNHAADEVLRERIVAQRGFYEEPFTDTSPEVVH